MTAKQRKAEQIPSAPEQDEELVLTDDQLLILQQTAKSLTAGIDSLRELIRTISNINPEELRKALENAAISLIETIDPDAIPADLADNPTIKTMVEQIRAGDLEQAKETIFHMRAGTFRKLIQASAEQEPTISQNLKKIEYIKYYGLMNDKINAQIIKETPQLKYTNGQVMAQWGINQAGDRRPDVPVFVSLSYYGKGKLTARNLDPFDFAVICAIATLGHATISAGGNYPIYTTVDEIFRAMNGIRDTRKTARPAQAKQIRNSIEKMRFSQIYIDRSEEIKAFNYRIEDERVNKAIIDDNIIHAVGVTFTTENHRKVNGYKIIEEPILYTYNREKNHVLFVPYELLDVSKNTRLDGYTIEIRNYLLNRIEQMYSGTLNSTSILFDTLYKETGILPPDQRLDRAKYKDNETYESNVRKQRARDKKKVTEILNDWKEKKYISGFKIKTAGNYSALITLNADIKETRKRAGLTTPEQLRLK